MSNIFVDTKPYTYSTLCDAYKKFAMPHNQRPYAWKPSHVGELWDAIRESDQGHFIGNLVCLAPSEDTDDSLVIIDGQQRLTTISLFLIAFKIILNERQADNFSKDIDEILNLIDDNLYWRNPRNHKNVPRLKPGKENLQIIYQNLLEKNNENLYDIAGENLDGNQSRYFANLKYILAILKKEIKDKKEQEIDVIIQKLLSVQFIAIVVKSENDIYDLFEGLNSTGLGLSVADLLKNAVLKSTSSKSIRGEIEKNWNQIEAYFENTKTALFPKFLRHYWISRNGLISTSRLFKMIKKEKIEHKRGDDVLEFTKELLKDTQIYIGLRFDDYEENLTLIKKDEKTKRIQRVFRYLNGLDQVYAVLLSFYNKKLQDEEYKLAVFREDLKRLLYFAILAKYVSVNPSDYEKIFASMCEISSSKFGNDYREKIGSKFKKLFTLVDNKDEFVANFSNNLEYGSDSKLAEYLLLELMRSYSHEDRGITVIDPNIEHILPQSPKKWGLSRESISSFVNKIGNLTILHEDDNNTAGNETIDIKNKKVYSIAKFKFNRDLQKYSDLFKKSPEQAIKKRGDDLGEMVFKLLKVL